MLSALSAEIPNSVKRRPFICGNDKCPLPSTSYLLKTSLVSSWNLMVVVRRKRRMAFVGDPTGYFSAIASRNLLSCFCLIGFIPEIMRSAGLTKASSFSKT